MHVGEEDRSDLAITVESGIEIKKRGAGLDGVPGIAQHRDAVAVILSEVKDTGCHWSDQSMWEPFWRRKVYTTIAQEHGS